MDDLISRQVAIELIHSLYPSAPIMRINRKQWEKKYKPYIEAEKALEQLPSAQPERKKGMWIHDGRDFPHGVDWIHCSVCGKKRINVPADLTSFCPNCGADMREEQDGPN